MISEKIKHLNPIEFRAKASKLLYVAYFEMFGIFSLSNIGDKQR